MAGASSKANGRQHSKNASRYKAQYMRTFRNKLARVKQSNGEKFAKTWESQARPNALARSMERPKSL